MYVQYKNLFNCLDIGNPKLVCDEISFPVGEDIEYKEYTVEALRKMVTLAVKLDGKVNIFYFTIGFVRLLVLYIK